MRIKFIKAIVILILFLLIVRIFYIVIVNGDKLKTAAFSQQQSYASNGTVYDRNFRVLSDKNDTLSHILGYSWDGGATGIYNVLAVNGIGTVDFKNAFGKSVSAENIAGVKLTVDYYIQKAAEEALENHGVCGAAIVIDANTGGVLAMASAPWFDRGDVSSYYGGKNGELINRALCGYNAGSVFKVVTAAAALETKLSYEYSFDCLGKTNIGGIDFVCGKKDGHGTVTFTQGFAHSCNCLFYNLGLTAGYDNIRKYATEFGFGEQVFRINGLYESRGNIPKNSNASLGDVANMSIGQGEILATPMQIADMMCTVANDGVRKQIMLIDGVIDDDGNCKSVMPTSLGTVVSTDTARALKQMLYEAVDYGTGKSAKINGVATSGKTATAESGWVKNGQSLTHGWFAGYFPSDNPKYVITVLVEGGSYGGMSAAPIFKEIGEKILDLY